MIDSTVDGSTADGPGGAIFTLDGDVTIVELDLNGNRADDRGGAISGEADVTIINSTIARNAAVAHVGGGVWSRGNMYVANSTISNNYAEAKGGGVFAAGTVGLVNSTVVDNIAPVAANIGAGERLDAFGSIIGPAKHEPDGWSGAAHRDATARCRSSRSFGLQRRHRRVVRPGREPPTSSGDADPVLGELQPDTAGSARRAMPQAA